MWGSLLIFAGNTAATVYGASVSQKNAKEAAKAQVKAAEAQAKVVNELVIGAAVIVGAIILYKLVKG